MSLFVSFPEELELQSWLFLDGEFQKRLERYFLIYLHKVIQP